MRADLQAVCPRERRRAAELLSESQGENSTHKKVSGIHNLRFQSRQSERPVPEHALCHISPKSLWEREGNTKPTEQLSPCEEPGGKLLHTLAHQASC